MAGIMVRNLALILQTRMIEKDEINPDILKDVLEYFILIGQIYGWCPPDNPETSIYVHTEAVAALKKTVDQIQGIEIPERFRKYYDFVQTLTTPRFLVDHEFETAQSLMIFFTYLGPDTDPAMYDKVMCLLD